MKDYPEVRYDLLVDKTSHDDSSSTEVVSRKRPYFSALVTICGSLLFGVLWIQICLVYGPNIWTKETQVDSFETCSPEPVDHRHNCWPQSKNVTKADCLAKNCCWAPSTRNGGPPQCFYPSSYQLYSVKTVKKTASKLEFVLHQTGPSGWPKDIKQLAVTVTMETQTKLNIKIYDPNEARYEVPLVITKTKSLYPSLDTDYAIDYPEQGPFYLTVTRRSTGKVIFDTKNASPLVFADQFLQIGTKLSTRYIYGLGEHMDDFLLDTNWSKKVMWARDLPPSADPSAKDVNLYGVHPFYLNIESDNNAHGVFLLNSNAMEIELQPSPELTYRSIGGVLDFYIFTGPSPVEVVQQYVDLIGRPFMPPYWSLGFHLSRHGYGGTEVLKKVIKRNRDAKMYYDSQWVDSDAMRTQLDWTYDSEGIWKGLLDVVSDLHEQGQHFNMLVDPYISTNQTAGTYPPYFDGLDNNVFIRAPNGSGYLVGSGWPGNVVYIDFTNPNTSAYWTRHAKKFHDLVPYDGHLIDMNEPSNFVNGSIDGCPNNTLENPPFVPSGIKQGLLRAESICVSARQYLSVHYNVHSLYGHSESIVAKKTLDTVIGKRSFAITRSSYAGTGVHAGHWSGDCNSEWGQLNRSISGMLSFQLFGIPFWGVDICGFAHDTTPEMCSRWFQLGVFYPFMWNHNEIGAKSMWLFGIPFWGVDICGFAHDTTPEMCSRWFQLGVFYPFMWNHNEIGAKDQDPGVFDTEHQDYIRKALELRYYLLPYLYTMLYRYHVDGTPFIMPLFFMYPNSDNNVTYTINKQFMWGTGLLATPALHQGVTETPGYLPKDRWYDFYTKQYTDSLGQFTTFDLPMDRVNVKLRGGSIIPMQTPEITTTRARKNAFILYVALSPDNTAQGELFWDDGEALDSISGNKYNLLSFKAMKNTLTSTPQLAGYTSEPMLLGHIEIMGVQTIPTSVKINGQKLTTFQYDYKVLKIQDITVDMLQPIHVIWD